MLKGDHQSGTVTLPVVLCPQTASDELQRGVICALSPEWVEVRFAPGQGIIFGNRQRWTVLVSLSHQQKLEIPLGVTSVMEHHAATVVRFFGSAAWLAGYQRICAAIDANAPSWRAAG
ncbi:MAG: hypothetical protein ACI8S6_000746 [Myxococcota bacterium]|jgi:hypothetical protein